MLDQMILRICMARRVASFKASRYRHDMWELRDEAPKRGLHSLRRAGQTDNQFSLRRPGGRSCEHCRATDRLIANAPKQFSEACKFFLEERDHGLDRDIARRYSSPADENQHVSATFQEVLDYAPNHHLLVR